MAVIRDWQLEKAWDLEEPSVEDHGEYKVKKTKCKFEDRSGRVYEGVMVEHSHGEGKDESSYHRQFVGDRIEE